MSDKPVPAHAGGIGYCGALSILFIGLRLCHVIAWSWWWVLAPLWIPIAILLVALVIVVAGPTRKR
jgi:hypothetical protein